MKLQAVFISALIVPAMALAEGTWAPLANLAPDSINTMLLLSDGTVMATAGSNAWYLLTPDVHGSYTNGAWSTLAPMNSSRLYFSSDVLTDGRVFVAGAEDGTGASTAEVYDPLRNSWTLAPSSGQEFLDSASEILGNGEVLVSPVYPAVSGGTVVYNPVLNSWSAGPTLVNATFQDEASWVKLPDGSILTADPDGTTSERYIPSLNQWVNDGAVPVSLYGSVRVEGGALLLPQGQAFFLGGGGQTALYSPSGTTNAGSWVAGPNIPNGQGAVNAPCAMMVNGRILCAVGPANTFNPPVSFYEYDPVQNSFTATGGPTESTNYLPAYETRMLDLPDGTVLFSDSTQQLYVYQPSGAPLAAGQPAISGITPNANGTYVLTGTLLNGISEGVSYDCDAEMRSNYPLIRMTNSAGQVYYARTFNWSSTGVVTGSTPETTQFALRGLPGGTYSLVVVANGNSSAPYSFTTVAPQMTPGTGFAAAGPVTGPFDISSQTYSLTNALGDPIDWTLVNTSLWLTVSTTNGTLAPGGPAAAVTVSLSQAAAFLAPGTYAATLWVSNLNNGVGQGLQFSLQVAGANFPISASGYNADVVVENTATGGNITPYTTRIFDSFDEYDFYQSGLNAVNESGGNATLEGLPIGGAFTSILDHATTFQFGPYKGSNVLFMDLISNSPSATLKLTSPGIYDSLAILAASATGGGAGSFILSFSDNSTSAPIAFNAPDWFSGASGAALTHFGAVYATGSNGQFYTDNPAGNEPSLYQTIVNLAALGLNAKPIVSLKFTMPDGAGTSVLTDTGVFALSGARLPYVVLPPSNLTVLLGGNATFTVTAGGTPPLQYQWLLNGVPLANNSQITGAQSNILNLGNIPAADAGSYQVMVANGSGIVTSKVATLSVVLPPSFQNVSVSGQSFVCSWTAFSGWQYQLQFNSGLTSNWINLGSVITATNSIMTATNSVTNSQCFYRLLLISPGH